MPELDIGGFVSFSTVDYPGMHAAVVFCKGCAWACRYCHNSHLQGPGGPQFSWEEVLRVLARRQGVLDAVVFSGGEPTLQPGLVEAIHQVKTMGFRAALHTGGSHPERLARTLPLLDWVGFDLKAPWSSYGQVTGMRGSGQAAKESLAYLLASGVPFELRTTLHGDLLSPNDLEYLAETAAECGDLEWVIQPFRPQGCRDEGLLARAEPSLSPAHAKVLAQARLRFPRTSISVRGDGSPTFNHPQPIRRSA